MGGNGRLSAGLVVVPILARDRPVARAEGGRQGRNPRRVGSTLDSAFRARRRVLGGVEEGAGGGGDGIIQTTTMTDMNGGGENDIESEITTYNGPVPKPSVTTRHEAAHTTETQPPSNSFPSTHATDVPPQTAPLSP